MQPRGTWKYVFTRYGWIMTIKLSQGFRDGPFARVVTAFAEEFSMRLARRVSEQIFAFSTGSELEKCGSVFSDAHFQSQQTLFIHLLALASGLCHCRRVDADALFVSLGL
ncbi:hypothetical protein T4B_14093 [Trichinella pseudospiralis]|uniref:Uncharacterized protein n=1 Tax=Trichinella pseudospiralis TaxID=6337 RepID=A0A0V1EF65_TRIPS|nr:hypothetical protein T4A_9228 [Trichinella pseudospiralis]KRZ24535.1 hypothetical protein T4B_14093 [Trichinella pseudospiralis]